MAGPKVASNEFADLLLALPEGETLSIRVSLPDGARRQDVLDLLEEMDAAATRFADRRGWIDGTKNRK